MKIIKGLISKPIRNQIFEIIIIIVFIYLAGYVLGQGIGNLINLFY